MNYKFFQHRDCEYFPCHQVDNLNCLFCFCPLYYLANCGGNCSYLKNQVKDCSKCLIPHQKNGYEWIIHKIKTENDKKKTC